MTVPPEPTYDSRDLADALESAVLALLRVPPIRQALYDLLRTYGLTAQLSELFGAYHDQMQAIAELLTLMYARLIEHDKRAIAIGQNTLIIMQRQELRMQTQDGLPATIMEMTEAEIARLHTEAEALIAAIDAEAERARGLLESLTATTDG